MLDEPASYTALPPTPAMMEAGISFGDLLDYARQGVHLLQTVGPNVVDLFEAGLKGWIAASKRDFAGVFAAIAAGKENIEAIVAAVKAEFGLE